MSRYLLCLLLLTQIGVAGEIQIPKGFSQAKMPEKLRTNDLRIQDMLEGTERYALKDAVFVDEDNKVWLVGSAVTFSETDPACRAATVTIRRSRLGYFIDFPYRYKKVDAPGGYSVPIHDTWRAGGHATPGYHIPAMSARSIDPVYAKPSPLRQMEHDLAAGKRASRSSRIPTQSEGQSDADFLLDTIGRVRSGK